MLSAWLAFQEASASYKHISGRAFVMNHPAQIDPCLDLSEEGKEERFSTVELCGGGYSSRSQFRVWTKTPSYLSILLDEGSEFASRYKPGDTLIVKFHHESVPRSDEYVEASVRRIKKESHGRLSGQYLVALDILNSGS